MLELFVIIADFKFEEYRKKLWKEGSVGFEW
jgi:hypothetical protein